MFNTEDGPNKSEETRFLKILIEFIFVIQGDRGGHGPQGVSGPSGLKVQCSIIFFLLFSIIHSKENKAKKHVR